MMPSRQQHTGMDDYARAESALTTIPSHDRETWIRVGMALKNGLGEEGFQLWDEWSATASNYDAKTIKQQWRSLKATGGTSFGTLFHLAAENGWQPPKNGSGAPRAPRPAPPPPPPDDSEERHAATAKKAKAILHDAVKRMATHPYLARKGFQDLKFPIDSHGNMVVPIKDADGVLHTLQLISPDGRKLFLKDGRKKACFFTWPRGEHANGDPLVVVEGLATGLSFSAATGTRVAVAFDAGNIPAVVAALQAKYPRSVVRAAPDGDAAGAAAAAKANADSIMPPAGKDWNDVHAERGLAAVAQAATKSLKELQGSPNHEVTRVTEVTPNSDGASGVTSCKTDEVTEVTNIPGSEGRPCFRNVDAWIEGDGRRYQQGVWFFDMKEGQPVDTWVCSPLTVAAVTFDQQGNNFGRLLQFRPTVGKAREWSMPMEMLRGSGEELRGALLSMGVEMAPGRKARELFISYVQQQRPKRRVQCATQTGWTGKHYILPDAIYGPEPGSVIFQSGEASHDEFTTAGTIEGWRTEVATRAAGNPILTLAIAGAFAGPLLGKVGAEGGGLHFVGDSSTGKTTALDAATSVWGGANFRRSWRSTANGMEGAAAMFNDGLLALDDVSEATPQEVGAIVYALGNGRGKQRASRNGAARNVVRWRCFVLSNGERTIGTTMMEGGHRAKAGQSVRLLDVPVARKFGAFDELHEFPNGAALADAIKAAALRHHGYAGRAYLRALTEDARDFTGQLDHIKAMAEFQATTGQHKRAAARLALLALAGEIATEYGLTGWPEGESIAAAAEGFRLWKATRGEAPDETRQILEQVRAFLERHGDSRFSPTTDDGAVRDRSGWYHTPGSDRVYLFTAEGMREALKGFDMARGLDTLQTSGDLITDTNGRRQKVFRIGTRSIRLYQIKSTIGGTNER